MTPSASSRWIRFQHGVDDSPTRSPISATDSEASCCRTVRILRSMASRRRLGSSGGGGKFRHVKNFLPNRRSQMRPDLGKFFHILAGSCQVTRALTGRGRQADGLRPARPAPGRLSGAGTAWRARRLACAATCRTAALCASPGERKSRPSSSLKSSGRGVEAEAATVADHDAGGVRLNFDDECAGHDKPVARLKVGAFPVRSNGNG